MQVWQWAFHFIAWNVYDQILKNTEVCVMNKAWREMNLHATPPIIDVMQMQECVWRNDQPLANPSKYDLNCKCPNNYSKTIKVNMQ